MLSEVFDSTSDGWLKRSFKTCLAPKTLKNFHLNLIIWHVLSISFQNLTILEKLAQNMTCLKILAQHLTRFQNLVSKCEAARKIWLMKAFFFSQKSIRNELSNTARKCQLYCFCSVRPQSKENVFFANFSMNFDSPQKIFLQNLKHCKIFDSNSDG